MDKMNRITIENRSQKMRNCVLFTFSKNEMNVLNRRAANKVSGRY